MITDGAHVAYIVLAPVGGIFMTTINVLTIFIFAKHFRLQTFSVIIIVNICICDIFVSAFSNFFYVINLLHPTYNWTTGNSSCKFFKMVTMLTNIVQIYSLCFINADRIRRLVNTNIIQWKKSHGVRVLAVIWTVSLLLTLPRLVLFEEKAIERSHPASNQSVVINVVCKPIHLHHTWYIVSTLLIFVLAYALPTCYVIYTSVRAQVFIFQRRKKIHLANINSMILKMNRSLSLTFNLTAALFLAVWSPFFILSILDLKENILGRKDLKAANFTLRCTLLIIGSAKPIIYFICLEKFRSALKCPALFGKSADQNGNSSSVKEAGSSTDANKTKNSKLASMDLKYLVLNSTFDSFPSPRLQSSTC